jgi:hypothetical protein
VLSITSRRVSMCCCGDLEASNFKVSWG